MTDSGVTYKKRKPAIKGIVAAAKSLSVGREHLRLVIQGKRSSPKLLARYRKLETQNRRAHD